MRIPPSFPASRSGSSASRKRPKSSARNSRGGRCTRPRSSSGASARRSGGSWSALTGCRVITPKALTCMTKPGRRALGPPLHQLALGQPVVGRVRLHHVEALGVVAQSLLAGTHLRRIPDLRQRLVRPGADADAKRGHVPSVRRRSRISRRSSIGARTRPDRERRRDAVRAAPAALRLRRPGAARRRADDAHPPRQAPPGVRRQREHGARGHRVGRPPVEEVLRASTRSRRQADRRPQQRRRARQPLALLEDHGPGRRRRARRRAAEAIRGTFGSSTR